MSQTIKIWILSLVLLLCTAIGHSQSTTRKNLNIPDIPGYKTLKCDLHMHTVFSDGSVWPSFRVEEAWAEGLDVIAITDHLGHNPKNRVDDENFNRNYEIAKPVADKYGLVLIRGSEITTRTKYGHVNALFLQDINLIDKENALDAIMAASEQGAFLTWNHPGLRQPNGVPVWKKEQDTLMQKGILHGIEIVNSSYYYPLAFTWCIEKKLTPMACSDIHDPAATEFDLNGNQHRPITLVFAKDTSLLSIKDALMQHRTLAYFENQLMGDKTLLQAIFDASVTVINPEFTIDADSKRDYFNYIQIKNNSCIDFEIELAKKDEIMIVTDKITLKANSTTILMIKPAPRDIKGVRDFVLKYKVKNLMSSPEECISFDLPVKITFI